MSPAAPALRAYRPDDEDAPLTVDGWPVFPKDELNRTLPDLWDSVLIPAIYIREPEPEEFLKKNGPYYRITLRVWSKLMGAIPLGAIDETQLAVWRKAIMKRPGRKPGSPCSAETVRRHWRYLRAILRMLAQMRLLDRVPAIRMPRSRPQPGDEPVILAGTWSQLCSGCCAWQFTKNPRIPGPLVGRGTLIWTWSSGLRTGDLFALDRSDVRLEPHCPVQRLSHLVNDPGWLYTINSKATKPALIPLTVAARMWFDETAKLLPPRQRHTGQLIPAGDSRSDSRDAHERQHCRRAIHAAAGMPTVYTFQELRAAANEAWNDAEDDAGDWLLGHAANRNVNTKHYRNGVRRLLRAVGKLTVPVAFQ